MKTKRDAPTIDLRSLDPGVHRFSFALDAETVDLEGGQSGGTGFRDIRAAAAVTVSREILIDLEATGVARLTCSRTLQDFDQQVGGDLRLVAVDKDEHALDGPKDSVSADYSLDEPDLVDAADGIVDLTVPIRDILLLAVPHRPVAPEAVDLEIPTSFGGGGDEAVDPRWNALRKLRDEGHGE